jgi:hypothetical protein
MLDDLPLAAGARLFVHLSDLHIPDDAGTAEDRDSSIRDHLASDIKARCEGLGKAPTAILVTGDIAFSGKAHQYEFAARWFDHLQGEISAERVLTVPGNHDVDRSKNNLLRNLCRNNVRDKSKPPELLDDFVRTWWSDERDGIRLYEPYDGYNEFALRYGCELSARRRYWEFPFEADDTLLLTDGSRLRIRGIDSALLSNDQDHIEGSRMFIGRAPMQLRPDTGPDVAVSYVIMCHHPPSWLRDSTLMRQSFRNKPTVQLFGHDHRQDVVQIERGVQIFGGAAHPEYADGRWTPTYNLILIDAEIVDGSRYFRVWVEPRIWSTQFQTFTSDPDPLGNTTRKFAFPLRPLPMPTTERELDQTETTSTSSAEEVQADESKKYRGLKTERRLWILEQLGVNTTPELVSEDGYSELLAIARAMGNESQLIALLKNQ